jgi:hypothetical protein
MICQYCGDEIRFNYGEKIAERLKDQSSCFMCDFWLRRIDDLTEIGDQCLIVDGVFYTIGREDDPSPDKWRGFGGRRFDFEFFAGPLKGEKGVTTNLWCRGDIPPAFRESIPDNARWINGRGRKR